MGIDGGRSTVGLVQGGPRDLVWGPDKGKAMAFARRGLLVRAVAAIDGAESAADEHVCLFLWHVAGCVSVVMPCTVTDYYSYTDLHL
jgi:hypothetical protein